MAFPAAMGLAGKADVRKFAAVVEGRLVAFAAAAAAPPPASDFAILATRCCLRVLYVDVVHKGPAGTACCRSDRLTLVSSLLPRLWSIASHGR